jgi:hypothetical protein
MKKLLVVIFFFLIVDTTFGQSRFSIGVQGGVSKLSTFSGPLGNELPAF